MLQDDQRRATCFFTDQPFSRPPMLRHQRFESLKVGRVDLVLLRDGRLKLFRRLGQSTNEHRCAMSHLDQLCAQCVVEATLSERRSANEEHDEWRKKAFRTHGLPLWWDAKLEPTGDAGSRVLRRSSAAARRRVACRCNCWLYGSVRAPERLFRPQV